MTRFRDASSLVAAFFARSARSHTLRAMGRRLAPSALIATILLPVSAIAAWGTPGDPGEYPFFGTAGAYLLDGQWTHVFANPGLQAGPFEIAPFGVAKLMHLHGHYEWFAYYLVMLWLVSFALATAFTVPLAQLNGRVGRFVPLLVLGVAVVNTAVPTAVQSGHLGDMFIPLMWIVAACLAKERMFVAAGALIGLSAGFEVWGVLGAPVILVATSPKIWRAAAGAVVAIVVIYLPFVLTGVFRMFDFHWGIMHSTLYRDIWPAMGTFPWPMRLGQAALAVAAGIVVALLARRSFWSIWLVAGAILSVRLVFDPLLFAYYWVAPVTVALCAVAVAAYLRAWGPIAIAAGVLALLWSPPAFPFPTAVLAALVVAGSVVAIRMSEKRQLLAQPALDAKAPALRV